LLLYFSFSVSEVAVCVPRQLRYEAGLHSTLSVRLIRTATTHATPHTKPVGLKKNTCRNRRCNPQRVL